MIAAAVISIILGAVFGCGILIGAIIKFGHPIAEEPLPFEADVTLHRDVHSTRWIA